MYTRVHRKKCSVQNKESGSLADLLFGWAKHEVKSRHHTWHTGVFLKEGDQDHGIICKAIHDSCSIGKERHSKVVVSLGVAN